jgi:superfamily I DNA and/or RNA helicase
VAWRLVRSYELRQNETERDRYLDALNGLIPVSLDEKETDQLTKRLSALRRVAFPSILELIQRGFERLDGWEQDVALTAGLPEAKLAQRMVSLQFQHRMHPDISAFPREQFYTSEDPGEDPDEEDVDEDAGQEEDFAARFEASLQGSYVDEDEDAPAQLLQDARSMLAERAWKYSRYARRALWVGVEPNKGKFGGKSNRNEAEAKVVLEELQHFVDWAQDHMRRDQQGKEKPWEVAVLTYYRGQEALFRERLQHLSRQYGNTRNFQLPRGQHVVHVTLCTVDRFQGHEADIVFLSFVKSGSVGFLNSPNRLNVALTRARYQIVLVGHQAYFSSERCPSDLLRAVAKSAHYKGDIKWESQP